MRGEILGRLWAQNKSTWYQSKAAYMAGMDWWDIKPHFVDGELVGATLTHGPEFHFATFGSRWQLNRADIRSYLQPILDAHGYVLTKTPKDDARQQRFNKLIGFLPDGEDEFYINYKLTHLRRV